MLTERATGEIAEAVRQYPGWGDLITKIATTVEMSTCAILVDQIKEKFGGLRFYITHDFEAGQGLHEDCPVWAAIEEAERASLIICEMCGQPGERRRGSWIRTLCDVHAVAELMIRP